jgi:hypothetical protein
MGPKFNPEHEQHFFVCYITPLDTGYKVHLVKSSAKDWSGDAIGWPMYKKEKSQRLDWMSAGYLP